jgi:hypothetical protein
MSTELAIANERGQSMAELMGISTAPSAEAVPSIARIGMLHQPIMGEVEFNGKMIKTEVVSIGTFTLSRGEEKVFSNGVSVRIFAQRQQWQRWNSETEEMEKSVLSNSLNGDLKDSIGGMNLGRPSGYIEDFNALPEETKRVIRSVKRVTVYYGTVSLLEPTNEKGEALNADDYKDIPFVMDVKNRDSLKSINTVMNSFKKKNMLPIMGTIMLTGEEDSIPTGAKFGVIKAKMGDSIDITNEDNDTLKDFIELIEYSNGKILDLHHERAKGFADQDEDLVKEILDNGFVEVDE